MKKIVKKIFNYLGYNISRKISEDEIKILSLDEIYKLKLKKNPIILDIGANEGQSIERFNRVFKSPIIHAFEPNNYECEKLKSKFKDHHNIIINNVGLGDKEEVKEFNVTAHSRNSSFVTPELNTKWIDLRSKEAKVNQKNYVIEKKKVKIDTVDNYCIKNNIRHIDLMKIDTQLYEDKVLMGSQNLLVKGMIDAIELEITFSKVYEKYFSFSDIEKYLIPNNFRFSAIKTHNNNLFSGAIFFAVALYLNKKKFKL